MPAGPQLDPRKLKGANRKNVSTMIPATKMNQRSENRCSRPRTLSIFPRLPNKQHTNGPAGSCFVLMTAIVLPQGLAFQAPIFHLPRRERKTGVERRGGCRVWRKREVAEETGSMAREDLQNYVRTTNASSISLTGAVSRYLRHKRGGGGVLQLRFLVFRFYCPFAFELLSRLAPKHVGGAMSCQGVASCKPAKSTPFHLLQVRTRK